MPFRLRKDARRWFRDISGQFTRDFDMYHLCLLAGLATERTSAARDSDTTVLVEHFPDEYRRTSRLIVGLFLTTQLKRWGVEADRAGLHEMIRELVDPDDLSWLTTAGMSEMNQYSYGGFDTITEWFDSRPRTFEGFFIEYQRRLEDAMAVDYL